MKLDSVDTIGGSMAYINACKPLASNTTCPIGTRVCQTSASEFKVMATNIAAWQYDEAGICASARPCQPLGFIGFLTVDGN